MAEGVSCHVLDAAPFFLSTSRHTLRKALNFALATSCAFLERRTDLRDAYRECERNKILDNPSMADGILASSPLIKFPRK